VALLDPPGSPGRPLRVLFYGTPAFALPTLESLLRQHEVVAVVTQPDRPAHRGQRVMPPPVKERALAAGLPVLQPARLRDAEWPARLRALGAEIAVVVAFGQILSGPVLAAPALGSINVHASALPRYRGAAPIAWAIMRGETETGITTFQMDEGMDTGPVLLSRATPIGAEETAGELAARLAPLGAEILLETLARLDVLSPIPQRHEEASLAPRLKKSDGIVDWRRPARELVNQIRGCNPWPGATTRAPRGLLTLWRSTHVPWRGSESPGTLVAHARGIAVATGEAALLPLEVQPESRRALPWDDYLRGARLEAGARFETP
jgi:methionyl-tRNA formyltransferase